MPQNRNGASSAASPPASTAASFDRLFSATATSPGVRQARQLAEPDLPPQLKAFSFVSADLLRHVAQVLGLAPDNPGRPGLRPRRPRAAGRAEGGCCAGGGGFLARRGESGPVPGGAPTSTQVPSFSSRCSWTCYPARCPAGQRAPIPPIISKRPGSRSPSCPGTCGVR